MPVPEYNPRIIKQAACLAMYRIAGGKLNKPLCITEAEVHTVVNSLGVNANHGQIKFAISDLLRASLIERQREDTWRLTERTKKAAEEAADELGTRPLPEPAPTRKPTEKPMPASIPAAAPCITTACLIDGLLDVLSRAQAADIDRAPITRSADILGKLADLATSKRSPLEAAAVGQVLLLLGTDDGEVSSLASALKAL